MNYTLNDLLRHLTALKKHTICTNLWLLNFPCDFIFSKVDCLKLLMLPASFCTNGKPHYIVFTFRLSALNSQLIKCKVYINVHKDCDTFFVRIMHARGPIYLVASILEIQLLKFWTLIWWKLKRKCVISHPIYKIKPLNHCFEIISFDN